MKGYQYRTIVWLMAFALALQFGLDRAIPASWVFHYRADYETIKGDMANGLSRAMDQIAREIRTHPEEEYVIFLGDSVAYSGPGGAEQSIGYYLEEYSREHGQPLKVYTLAQPGMMLGDVYTELLMLKDYGIPLKRVIINTIYTDYRVHGANDPWFGWLGDELHRRDSAVWEIAGGKAVPERSWMAKLRHSLLGWTSLWQNRDILRARIYQALRLSTSDEVKDVRPWTEKAWLKNAVKGPAMQAFVDPNPVDLSSVSVSVQMWQRIIEECRGAELLLFFAPMNQDMLSPWAGDPGFQENLRRIDQFFTGQPVTYVNLAAALPSEQFTDHVHLVPEGYRNLAVLLGERLLAQPSANQP